MLENADGLRQFQKEKYTLFLRQTRPAPRLLKGNFNSNEKSTPLVPMHIGKLQKQAWRDWRVQID